VTGDVYTAFTLSDYRYDYAWFQPASNYLEFKVRSCNDAHILLTTSLFDETDGYEIVVGGYGNTASDIRRGSHGEILLQVYTPDIMSCDEYLPFWIRWGDNAVEFGSGRLDDHIIMRLSDPQQPIIRAMSVTSWLTAPGEYHFPQSNIVSSRAYTFPNRGFSTLHRSLLDTLQTVFRVRSASDAKVALLSIPGNFKAPSYELVIGAAQNTMTVLRCRSVTGDVVFDIDTPDILNVDELRSFWIGWTNGTITFGKGEAVGINRLLRFQDPNPTYRKYIHSLAVASEGESTAEWEFGDSFNTTTSSTTVTPVVESSTVTDASPFPSAPPDDSDEFYRVYTESSYDFDHVVLLTERKYLVFFVKACQNAHVILSHLPGVVDSLAYNITLGASGNTKSVVHKLPPQETTKEYDTPGVLQCENSEGTPFWMLWSEYTIRVGRGTEIDSSELFSWTDTQSIVTHAIALASRDSAPAVWKFPKDSGKIFTLIAVLFVFEDHSLY